MTNLQSPPCFHSSMCIIKNRTIQQVILAQSAHNSGTVLACLHWQVCSPLAQNISHPSTYLQWIWSRNRDALQTKQQQWGQRHSLLNSCGSGLKWSVDCSSLGSKTRIQRHTIQHRFDKSWCSVNNNNKKIKVSIFWLPFDMLRRIRNYTELRNETGSKKKLKILKDPSLPTFGESALCHFAW